MQDEKQVIKTKKIKGVLSLILAIILTLASLKNTPLGILRSFGSIYRAIAGQPDSYGAARAIGYLLGSALLVYCIFKLFQYSSKILSKNAGRTDEQSLDNS